MGRPRQRPWRTSVLLIGPTRGKYAISRVAADLSAMKDALTDARTGIAFPERTAILDDPTAADVLEAVRWTARGLRDDLLVCYFSGHGYADPRDQTLRLGMRDSERDYARPDTFGLAYRALAEALLATRAARIVVILDCCWSGLAKEHQEPREDFCLLTSVQANRRTPQSDTPDGTSPYTEALIKAMSQPPPGEGGKGVLAGRLADDVEAAFLGRYLSFNGTDGEPTEEEISAASEGVRLAHRWLPQYSHTGASILLARPQGLPALPRRSPTARAWAALRGRAAPARGRAARTPEGRRALRRGAAALLALAVVAAGVLVAVSALPSHAVNCPPPLELRVLASTEDQTALGAAADSFETSDVNHRPLGADDGLRDCRRVNITVYAAHTNQVVSAFAAPQSWSGGEAPVASSAPAPSASAPPPASSSGAGLAGAAPDCAAATPAVGSLVSSCPEPLRDVGPQPDVWIPDSSAELTLARGQLPAHAGVSLTARGSVATSRLVLAVSRSTDQLLSKDGLSTTSSWEALLNTLVPHGVSLLRPGPLTSDTGLLQTAGLYLGYDGTLAASPDLPPKLLQGVEKTFASSGHSAADADQLLCGLLNPAKQSAPVAALVSTQELARLRDPGQRAADCADDDAVAQTVPPLTVYHPSGVPVADHPFVTVTWSGADDRSRRAEAAARFRDFLLGPTGARELAASGYDPPAGSGAATTSPVLSASQLTAVLRDYEQSSQPVRVLFLLDQSGSTADGRKLTTAVAGLKQALGALRSSDSYGIWTFPSGGKDPTAHRTLVALGPHGTGKVTAPARAKPQPRGAALYEAIRDGVRALREQPGDQPRLLVVLTDGDDRPQGSQNPVTAYAQDVAAIADGSDVVPVDVVGMNATVCDQGSQVAELTRLSGSRYCRPASGQLGRQLTDLIAAARKGSGT